MPNPKDRISDGDKEFYHMAGDKPEPPRKCTKEEQRIVDHAEHLFYNVPNDSIDTDIKATASYKNLYDTKARNPEIIRNYTPKT